MVAYFATSKSDNSVCLSGCFHSSFASSCHLHHLSIASSVIDFDFSSANPEQK